MFRRSCIDTGKLKTKFRQLKLLICPQRTYYLDNIDLQIDFSLWQFILPKSLRPSAFHSVHSIKTLLQKCPHILLQLKISAWDSWQWEMQRGHNINFIYMTQYKHFRLASQKTYCSLFRFGESRPKYTGYEFSNKNHFAVLQLKKSWSFLHYNSHIPTKKRDDVVSKYIRCLSCRCWHNVVHLLGMVLIETLIIV